jgi:hyperosmotically inducible protein
MYLSPGNGLHKHARHTRACLLIVACVTLACARSDSELRAAVETQIAIDPVTAPARIAVAATNGVVRLSGETSTREEERKAVELARSVRGVKDVVNELRLSNDAVQEAVRQALAADPMVGHIGIDVAAGGGVVHLRSDETNKEERQRAVAVASAVDGVTLVHDFMK